MTSSRKGRLSPLTGAFAADIETLPTTGPHQLCYYSEGFQASDGFVNDQVICHGAATARDMTPPAPALKRASGNMNVPMDLAQILFFLQMLCGPAISEVDNTGVVTREFESGSETQRLAAFSIPVTDDRWKLVKNAYLNSMSFEMGKQDGYRTMDLGFLTPNVSLQNSEPAFAAAASPTTYTHRKVVGKLGTFSIGGTVVAQIVSGGFSFSNQGELIDLVDGTDESLGQETGDTLIRFEPTLRVVNGVGVNDVLDNFRGAEGAAFAAQIQFQIDANASLTIDLPYCKGERRFPTIANAQRQTFAAPIQAFQDGGNAAAKFTLVNEVAI